MAVFLKPDKVLTVKIGNSTLKINQKIIPDGTLSTKDICEYVKKGQKIKPQAKLSNGTGKPRGITIHNTEMIDVPDGTNPAEQYTRATFPNLNMGGVVVHFWIYKSEIWQQLSEDERGWHAADGSTRRKSQRADGSIIGGNLDTIALEIIESSEDKETEETAAKLVAYLLDKYDLSPKTDIYTHKYFKPSKVCPYFILPHLDRFVKMVTDFYDDIQAAKKPDVNAPTAPEVKKWYRVQVGAFSVKANAEALAKKLQEQGYKDAYVV
jgi:N-acetylmuramoyl-L-alanine amidase CwlA